MQLRYEKNMKNVFFFFFLLPGGIFFFFFAFSRVRFFFFFWHPVRRKETWPLFLIFRVHVNLDLRHFGTKKAETIVYIAKVSEKCILVLNLLVSVCPKCIQFWFKEKSFIVKTFHYLKFRRPKQNLVIHAWWNIVSD